LEACGRADSVKYLSQNALVGRAILQTTTTTIFAQALPQVGVAKETPARLGAFFCVTPEDGISIFPIKRRVLGGALRTQYRFDRGHFKGPGCGQVTIPFGKQSQSDRRALKHFGIVVVQVKSRTTPCGAQNGPLTGFVPSATINRQWEAQAKQACHKWAAFGHPRPDENDF
jgi:hypothetical protein